MGGTAGRAPTAPLYSVTGTPRMPFPTANAAEAPTFPTATAAEAQVRSLVSGDASAPVGVADLQAATRALGELVRSNLRPLARAADGRLLFVAAPASENEVTSRCLRLLALVWSKPPFRTMLHHRHLAEELGAPAHELAWRPTLRPVLGPLTEGALHSGCLRAGPTRSLT